MPDYKQGKIYAIRSHQTDKVYISATTQNLSMRMSGHRGDYKKGKNSTASTEILKHNDAYIELIELFPCESKIELDRREGEIIRQMDCVNKNISGRTKKEWVEKNIEKLTSYKRKWYIQNSDKVFEKRKDYNQTHKSEISERNKEYVMMRKEKISAGKKNGMKQTKKK